MNNYRKNARAAGILYIIGTVAGVLSAVFTNPITTAEDTLAAVSSNPNAILIGSMMVLVMGLSLAMVPLVVFPVLKKHSEPMAIGYVVFRSALEMVTYLFAVVSFLLLLPLSQEYASAGSSNALQFQTLAAMLQGIRDLSLTPLIFGIGALIFYSILYRSKLIPKWISMWGIFAILLHLISAVLVLLGLQTDFDTASIIMALPIGLQELFMAAWFIIKGFDLRALTDKTKSVTIEN